MKINVKNLGAAVDNMKKIPWILGSHAFLAMLFFILLDLVVGIALFYQYVVLAKTSEPKNINHNITFEYRAYQKVLEQWRAREQYLQESKSAIHQNPFSVEAIAPPENTDAPKTER